MTVGELITQLRRFRRDRKVILANDATHNTYEIGEADVCIPSLEERRVFGLSNNIDTAPVTIFHI